VAYWKPALGLAAIVTALYFFFLFGENNRDELVSAVEQVALSDEDRDAAAWAVALEQGTMSGYVRYRMNHPEGTHANDASDEVAWLNALRLDSDDEVRFYLKEWPLGRHMEDARYYLNPFSCTTTPSAEIIFMQVSTGGCVAILTFGEIAPNHVTRFMDLSRQGFFDGIVFHRVIAGFMAQTGDPTGTGSGGSGQYIAAEFNAIKHVRGIVSAARASDPDSADSQFFIMYDTASSLDGQYTAWGQVLEGMEYIDALTENELASRGTVPEELRHNIIKMRISSEIDQFEN
jgi:cyclophilin family peptidyl-prolyl cis-trans isomerase